MSDSLKKEILELLYFDSIDFRVSISHKGSELEIFERNEDRKEEIKEVLEEWICYGDLFEFLFNSGTCYSYEGIILAVEEGQDEEYFIKDAEFEIQIIGPNEGETDPVKIDFSNFLIAEKLELNSLIYGLNDFENELFQVEFFIEEWRHINRFDLFYLNKDNRIKISLDDNQKEILINYVVEFAKTKEPELNLNNEEFRELISVSISGEENFISYHITEYYKFLYDDIYI
jgi:hypothetical protein